ncbi:hypothetical protein F4823DRAFT_561655 [Ustulina deusta]|nr:hypothetical protein F4823DRAFT_561655 [Ustulina deusta]
MRHAKGLLTPARALHRVLLLALANSTTGSLSPTTTALPSSWARARPSPPPTATHARTPCPPRRPFSTTSAAAAAQPKRSLPRDRDIPYRWVRIASGSGVLSGPQRTETVLAGLPSGHSLEMVAPPPAPPAPSSSSSIPTIALPPAAICRIVDVDAEVAAAAAAAAREAKEASQVAPTKTLEINWSIAAHDLAHRMRRLEEFLGKGLRVDVMLARKRGCRRATDDEGQTLVEKIREAALNVPGTAEYKRMAGVVCGVLRLYFEGPKAKWKGKKKGGGHGKAGEEEAGEERDETGEALR